MADARAGVRMVRGPVSRRRALLIVAGGAAMLLAGKHVRAADDPYVWEGTALGAPARLILCGTGRAEARAAVVACVDEVARLERQFSLYRPDCRCRG